MPVVKPTQTRGAALPALATRRMLAAAGALLLCALAVAGAPAFAGADPAAAPAEPAAAAAPQPVDLSGQANTSLDTAVPVSFGQQVADYADGAGTRKYYRVDLPSAGRVTVDATVPWEGLWGQGTYRIVDAAGTDLWSYDARNDWNATTQQSHSVLSVDLTAGTYYLVVGEDDAVGGFAFALSFADAAETVPEAQGGSNNSLAAATPVELDASYTGQLAVNDTDDFYTFTLPTAGRVTLDGLFTFQGTWSDNLHLFDAAGNELWSYATRSDWNDTTAQAVTAPAVDLTAGTYYLSVSYAGDDWYGPYTFALNFEDAAESAPEAQGGSNNDLASATPVELGATYRAQLALNDQVDFFSFEVPAAGTVGLSFTSWWPKTYSTALYLYDSAGTEVWSYSNGGDWNDLTASATSSVEVELEAGSYYFAVQRPDSDVTGPYEFCWSTGGAQAAVLATDGAAGTSADAAASDAAEAGPVADGTYTASMEGSLGAVDMTVSIADGRLAAVDVTFDAGVTPDEYASLYASCLSQARAAAAAQDVAPALEADPLAASIEAKLASMGEGGA